MKDFAVAERQRINLRFEVFNLANHAQFQLPNANPDTPGGASVTSTLPNNQREIQVALKYLF